MRGKGGGLPTMVHIHSGVVAKLPIASCYGNQNKPGPVGPLGFCQKLLCVKVIHLLMVCRLQLEDKDKVATFSFSCYFELEIFSPL